MLQLRPHQQEVINALNEGFKTHQRQILCAVTGFGKTECAMAIMQEAAKEGKKVAKEAKAPKAEPEVKRSDLSEKNQERAESHGPSAGQSHCDERGPARECWPQEGA